MSYKATAWAYDLNLPSPRKFVLVALADFADENGSCYPGQGRLMKMTGLGERAVRNSLAKLEDEGLIERMARYQGGHRITDRYRLMMHVPAPDAGSSGADSIPAPDAAMRRVIPAPQTVHTGTSRHFIPAPRAGEPSVEPSENRKGAQAPSPNCHKHPDGTDRPCRACGEARKAHDRWVLDQKEQQRLASSRAIIDRQNEWAANAEPMPEVLRRALGGDAA